MKLAGMRLLIAVGLIVVSLAARLQTYINSVNSLSYSGSA
jgi:hypothetical protein